MNATVRLFQIAAYGWLALYMLALITLGDAAWTNAPVDLFITRTGFFGWLQRSVNAFPGWCCFTLCVLVLVLAIVQLRRHRWWLGLLVWLLFRIITHRTWLASNGGIQLMENMLFWSALMGVGMHDVIRSTAFWIARFQLLLVYAVAAAHKFAGTTWLDGTAMLLVASDPNFHLRWLASSPGLCTMLTYAGLAFMTLFPIAVWWSPSRRVFLIIGALFHLATAVFMDIPQMGLAFIACYAIWLTDEEASALISRLNVRSRVRHTAT